MTFILFRENLRLLMIAVVVSLLFLVTQTAYAQTNVDSPADASTHTANQYRLFTLPITVSGGLTPYGFTITSGSLPSGMELIVNDARDGATIEGVTSDTADSTVTVEVSDSKEGDITTDTVSFTISITPVSATTTIIIDDPDQYLLTEGSVGDTYPTVEFSTTDGDTVDDAQYSWAITAGTLPAGMALSSGDGTLIGTPTESGVFPFTLQVTDIVPGSTPNKLPGTRDYKLVITGSSGGGDLQISSPTSANLPSGVLGNTYTVDVDASGGDGLYLFTQSGLPGGLAINSSTGLISGSPNATGTFNVTITVTDNNGSGNSANRNYSLTINATGIAGYSSNPSPGSTIDFGTVNIGASFSQNLIVSESGSATLNVTQPGGGMIQGADASKFSITSNSPPFSIANGGGNVIVRITCTPDASDDYDAFLQFNTNDADNPTVVYSLFCSGVIDGGAEDDDTTDDGGTSDGDAEVVDNSTPTPSIPTRTPLPPTYSNVIEVEGLSLRTGPFIGASRRGVLRPEVNYRVTAKNNLEGVYMWYYIITDDGLEGWASGRYLAVYGDDVPFAGSVLDNVWNERDRGVVVEAIDNIHFRPGPSDRTQPYVDLIPWAGRMRVFGRTMSGRGDEWYAVEYNGVRGWVYAGVVKVVEGLMEAIPKY